MPAGSPVSVATKHSPCDSPAVSNRSIRQRFYGNTRTFRLRETYTIEEALRAASSDMVKFLLFCILLVLCWPLALAALVLYPLVWLLLLPFRIVGIAVGGVLELIWALVTLPARILKAIA